MILRVKFQGGLTVEVEKVEKSRELLGREGAFVVKEVKSRGSRACKGRKSYVQGDLCY